MIYKYRITFILFFLLAGLNLNAGEIITWTDKDGTLNLSNLPPPHGVHVREVIQYKEITDNQKAQRQDRKKTNLQRRLKNRKSKNAEKAANEAKKAELRAIKARDKASEYIDKNAPRKKSKRKGFRYRREKAIEAVRKAEAYEKQAKKKAEETEIIEEIKNQKP